MTDPASPDLLRRSAHRAPSPGTPGRCLSPAGLWRAGVVLAMMPLGGCISVHAPEKPIVIELNINIKQEVVYRLNADAGKTIDANKEIF